MSSAEIVDITFAQGDMPEAFFKPNSPADKFRRILFRCFLIKTEERKILVDAGCETMPGFVMRDFIGPLKALEKLNVNPADITDVIITHSHHDHIECVKYFKNAVIYIQRDEYESGKGYFAEGMNIKLFDDEMQICPGVKAVTIGGHSKGSCIVEITDNGRKYIIAGDECYSYKCLEYKIPTGNSYCLEKSRQFIEKYSDPSYRILLCHER